MRRLPTSWRTTSATTSSTSFINDSMTSADSAQLIYLANLCPQRNGTVVYQARALYSYVFNNLDVFNDDSCMSVNTTYMAGRYGGHTDGSNSMAQAADGQQYWLRPNPNNGNITLLQMVADDKPVHAEIFDAVGRKVYAGDLMQIDKQGKQQFGNFALILIRYSYYNHLKLLFITT